jgi:hypothetical protein
VQNPRGFGEAFPVEPRTGDAVRGFFKEFNL